MQPNWEKSFAQQQCTVADKTFLEPLSHAVTGDHTHRWVYLSHGYEVCTVCGAIRQTPAVAGGRR